MYFDPTCKKEYEDNAGYYCMLKKLFNMGVGAGIGYSSIAGLGILLGVTPVGPVAGGAFAAAQAAGWMGGLMGPAMAAFQSAVMTGGGSYFGAAAGAWLGNYFSKTWSSFWESENKDL